MAKIFVHIGLPKTATTTLQRQVFSNISNESLNYLGVYQPRESKQNSLYNYFYRAIYTGKKIDKVQKLIEIELNKGRNLLISEEMIVLSTFENKWRANIKNLYQIIKPFDYLIIVTVREPASAMFSFYAQRYKMFKKLDKSFKEIALKHDSMEIFHYKKFFKHLNQYFKVKKVFVKKFEEIINNDFDDLLQTLKVDNFNDQLNNYNSKEKTKEVVNIEYNLSLVNDRTLIYFKKIGLVSIIEKLHLKPMLLKSFLLLKHVNISKKDKIIIPTEIELNKIRFDLKDETNYLFKKHKINYFK